MDAAQSLRLVGTTDILEISCDQDDGQNVIYWNDILDVFPGAQYVKNGNSVVKRLRHSGSGGNNQRIKHHPGVILDVVLSTSVASDPIRFSTVPSKMSGTGGGANEAAKTMTDFSMNDNIIEDRPAVDTHVSDNDIGDMSSLSGNGSSSQLFDAKKDPKAVLSLHQVALHSQTKSPNSTFEQRLVTSLPPDLQAQVCSPLRMYMDGLFKLSRMA
ncbi:hypothetical protein BGX31_001373 [Mortierella sp. GBA43]|nr:hypothetical protein BGX31_001373 [Mortierella sp. GBA43]